MPMPSCWHCRRSIATTPRRWSDWPGLADALAAIGFTGEPAAFQRVFAPDSTPLPARRGRHRRRIRMPRPSATPSAPASAPRPASRPSSVAVVPTTRTSWRAAAEGAALGGYRFDGYKTESAPSRARSARDRARRRSSRRPTSSPRVHAAADAVALVKDLVEHPRRVARPGGLRRARRRVRRRSCPSTVEVLDEAALDDAGLRRHPRRRPGLRPAAAPRPPRLRARRAPTRHVALVGKGITFDTGGLSLKPAASDGRHEVRHVRRRDGARASCAPSPTLALPVRVSALAVHRRQHALGPGDAPGRRAAHARRHDRRGAQHGRRGPRSCSPTASSRRAASIPT